MNRKFMFGLSDLGVNVKYDTLPSSSDMEPEIMERLNKLTCTRVPKGTPKIYGMTAPLHYDWDKYKLLFTMMETRRLHPGYVERCNCADEVVVPSRWCEQVFRESGVKKPMTVVPLGVDLNIYRPDAEPIEFTKQIRPFVFLSVFGWSLRKGYDVLLKAYLEEFTSDDPVTLLISSRYFGSTDETKKQVIRNDVAKVSAFVKNQKKPHVMLFGDVLSDQMMPRLFAAADCYVLPTRGEGFGLPFCFPEKTWVQTSSSTKNIEEMERGDVVVTHDGTCQKVLSTMKRAYSGPMVDLRVLMNNIPVVCTPDHPFFVVKKMFRKANDKRHLNFAPEWTRACDIKKGDLLVVPAVPNQNVEIDTLDLAIFLDNKNMEVDVAHVWSKYSNRPNGITSRTVAQASGVSRRQVYRILEAKDKDTKIPRVAEEKRLAVLDVMDQCDYENESVVFIKRFIDVDEKTAELAGYYTAEGSCGKTTISFAFHSKETHLHDRVKALMKEVLGVDSFYERFNGNRYELIFSSSIAASFFVHLCGKYATQKCMSPLLFKARESVRTAFVQAFFEGDGHATNRDIANVVTYNTSSPKLADQIWRILLCNGTPASLLRKSLRKKQANHEYVIQATVNSPLDKRQRGRYRKTISGEGFYLAPVKSASLFDYNGHVFNFEVEYNNSYCANGFAVHNCEAGACGLPVIATRYSGQTDFLDDKNSWLIDVDGFRSAERELAWISYFYENAEFPILGPKAVEQLRHCMREAFEKKELAKTKANRLHKRVVKEYGWDAAIQQMHDKLKATFDQLAK